MSTEEKIFFQLEIDRGTWLYVHMPANFVDKFEMF